MAHLYFNSLTGKGEMIFFDDDTLRTCVRTEVSLEPAESHTDHICVGEAFALCGQGADQKAARNSLQSVLSVLLDRVQDPLRHVKSILVTSEWESREIASEEAQALIGAWESDERTLVFERHRREFQSKTA